MTTTDPSVAYNACHKQRETLILSRRCEASVRYGALLRHRDGGAMEFDSGWTEATYEQDFAFSSDPLTYCYWAALRELNSRVDRCASERSLFEPA